MSVVYRYELNVPITTFGVPDGTSLISFGYKSQRGKFYVWAMVPEEELHVEKTVKIVGTGGEIPEGGKFIGSCVMPDGFHVFHAFEVKK